MITFTQNDDLILTRSYHSSLTTFKTFNCDDNETKFNVASKPASALPTAFRVFSTLLTLSFKKLFSVSLKLKENKIKNEGSLVSVVAEEKELPSP